MKEVDQLDPYIRKQVGEYIANTQTHPLPDPHAQVLQEKFITSAALMDRDQQETTAILYAEHIARVSVPKPWWSDSKWLDQVGRNRNLTRELPEDGAAFYQKLNETIPGLLTDDELEWLIKNDPMGGGGDTLLFWLCRFPQSDLPVTICNYIHAWK